MRPQNVGLGTGQRALLMLLLGGVGCAFFVSCVAMREPLVIPPDIPGATFVGNQICSACHERHVKAFPASVHARLAIPGTEKTGETGCEACHGPGSRHARSPAKEKLSTIVNPGKSPQACYRCHFDKEAEFSLPYRHPLGEGKVTCASCHDPHGADSAKSPALAMARVNDTCRECHREQTLPRAFEHEAMREGCTTCHAVHGSINPKLLTENDSNLCLKCHAQRQAAGGVWIGTSNHSGRFAVSSSCWTAGCHTAVHGSNINSHLRY